MLLIQNYMVLNGDISSQQITCGPTYLRGHVHHRSRHRMRSTHHYPALRKDEHRCTTMLVVPTMMSTHCVLHRQQRCHFDHDPLGRRLFGMLKEVHIEADPRRLVWYPGGCSGALAVLFFSWYIQSQSCLMKHVACQHMDFQLRHLWLELWKVTWTVTKDCGRGRNWGAKRLKEVPNLPSECSSLWH